MTLQIHVSDFAHGVQASYDDMGLEAGLLRQAGQHLAGTAIDLEKVLLNPDLVASTLLDPRGVAKVEEHLLAALDGPHGLVALALELEARALGLYASVQLLKLADEALADLTAALKWGVGYALGATANLWGPAAYGIWRELSPKAHSELEAWLVAHAGWVQEFAGTLPGLLTGLESWLPGPDVPVISLTQGAGMLAALFPNGRGSATLDNGPGSPDARGVKGLLEQLQVANLEAQHRVNDLVPAQDPVIQVHKLVHQNADGSETVSWIVDIPGTSAWDGPGNHSNPTDTSGNLNSMAGNNTAYQQAILDAMKQAGVEGGQAIMLVGHSQGGMVAVQASSELVSRGYDVTNVLTAGSPIGGMHAPSSVHVLSLENTADVVPSLDGASNEATPNHTTVTFTKDGHTIGINHGIDTSYEAGAAAVDASDDPSLVAWKDSASAFFDPNATTETSTFVVHRG